MAKGGERRFGYGTRNTARHGRQKAHCPGRNPDRGKREPCREPRARATLPARQPPRLRIAGAGRLREHHQLRGILPLRRHQLPRRPQRYRYTGKEKDEESGLYYHGARYYACWLGRWTAADPIGIGDGMNVYMYVRGNPVKLQDPSGTQTVEND